MLTDVTLDQFLLASLSLQMLSSVTDRDRDVNVDKLDALRPENIDKNRFKDVVPCTRLLILLAICMAVPSVP